MNYYIILIISAMLGTFVIWRQAGLKGYSQEKVLDVLAVLFLAIWVGARLSYFLFYHSGGYLFFGGVFVGFLVFRWLSSYFEWDFLEVGDILVPGFLLLQALLPLKCLLTECTRDTFWLESAFFLLFFYLVFSLKRFSIESLTKKGVLTYTYASLMPLFYLVLNLYSPVLSSEDRILAVACFVLVMIGWLRLVRRTKSNPVEDLRLELTFRSRQKRRPLTMQNLPNVNMFMFLPKQFIKQVRLRLSHQEKRLEEEISLMEKEDPFKDVERTENNAEMVAEATEQSGHVLIDMQVKFLRETLKMVRGALERIQRGTYGISVRSGKPIPKERLEVVPTADLTVEEEKAKEKEESTQLPPMERIN